MLTDLPLPIPAFSPAKAGTLGTPLNAAKLATLPAIQIATPAQRRFALIVSICLLAVTALLLPYAHIAWPNNPAFLPTFQTAAIGICLITACLMYGHYVSTRSTVLLHLSAGYLYTAGILLMQFLSFPGVLIETGRLFGGPRTTSWLWAFWHIGPALSILYYAWSEHRRPGQLTKNHRNAVFKTGLVLVAALAATAFLVSVLHDSLPILDVNGKYSGITALLAIAIAVELMLVSALALLWRASGFRNVLHVWLGIVVVALLCDNAITIIAGSRLAMGWYLGRLIALIAFSVMMLVYLHEIFTSYRRTVEVADNLAHSKTQLDLDIERRTLYEKALVEADRQKDEFLVMLAHELRNPLAPIRTAALLLSRDNLDDHVIKKTSQMLTRQVKQLTTLVDDLMDISRVTRGLTVLRQVAIDARQIASEAVEQVSPLIDARQHHLEVHLPKDAVFVLADHARMVQVMTNLITNSAKYTKPGGHIVVQIEARSTEVIFLVTDNGIGMSPELVQRAFKLFTQGELTSDRSHGGLGIGLALVKSLVELHGGQVYATSKGAGLGSEFRAHLPRILTSQPANEPALHLSAH